MLLSTGHPADTKSIEVLIFNTNSDLNIYKEMWRSETADEPAPTSSCCDPAKPNIFKGTKKLPDVDFNHWTGEST